MNIILENVTTILGFGFLGLSFLFVYLAYQNVRQIVGQPSPTDAAVGLCRFFMKTALFFMICAGPLQWISIAIDNHYKDKKITLHVTMTHPEWEEAFGEVLLIEKGAPHSIINTPFVGLFGQDDEVQLNGDKVAAAIRKIRAQLSTLDSAHADARLLSGRIGGAETISPVTRGVLQGG